MEESFCLGLPPGDHLDDPRTWPLHRPALTTRFPSLDDNVSVVAEPPLPCGEGLQGQGCRKLRPNVRIVFVIQPLWV